MERMAVLSLPNRGFPQLVGDAEGLFMHCHQVTAEYLALKLKNLRILELCCGIGTITSALSLEAESVYAVDSNSLRIKCAAINLSTYGDPSRVTLKVADVQSETIWKEAHPDVVFADPDWAKEGDNKSTHTTDISETQPPVTALLNMANSLAVQSVVMRLSLMSNLDQLATYGHFEAEKVCINGIEKYWLVYFGALCVNPGEKVDLKLNQ
ncbi:RsmD family RNA methyltransferase [Gemmatimonadota bacterium]